MFCKRCGKEVQEEWSACPNCGETIEKNVSKAKNEKTNINNENDKKARGTSNAPIILGIVGGALGIPSALCSGMCASMVGSTVEESNELGSFYLYGILIAAVIAIIFACVSRKNPKLAGVMLVVATLIMGILTVASFNLLGIISTVLVLIAGIICFIQKKDY